MAEILSSKNKGIGDFACQGSAGGAISIFLLTLISVLKQPNGYNVFLIPYLPMILFTGAAVGVAGGFLVWLFVRTFKLRAGVLLLSVATVVLITSIVALTSFVNGSPIGLDLLLTSLVPGVVVGLPSALLTSSNVRPWRLVLFGSHRVATSRWPSFLTAFVIRTAALSGLIVSLFLLAWWASFLSVDWGVKMNAYGIAIAICYFTASMYVGFRPPRKWSLLIAGILLNVPLAAWALNASNRTDAYTKFVATIALLFAGLWVVFIVCVLLDSRLDG